jgi:hypothetical protein
MTKAQADAVVHLISANYPDAATVYAAELEADADGAADDSNDYSVAFGKVVADTLAEVVDQLKEDSGDDAETQNAIAHIEAMSQPDTERALEETAQPQS